ncbi:MAG: hypothetical protein JSR93_05180 [Verrucomicrobia bacterium]|nr:hypothetical protein [Verrucomicrobiota bacterium]
MLDLTALFLTIVWFPNQNRATVKNAKKPQFPEDRAEVVAYANKKGMYLVTDRTFQLASA